MTRPTFIGVRKRRRLAQKSRNCCWYCGRFLEEWDWTVDHVVPRKHGGDDSIDNLVIACQSCNLQKRTMSLDEYRNRCQQEVAEREGWDFTQGQIDWLADQGISVRQWICLNCGVMHDRDINASVNILNETTRGARGSHAMGSQQCGHERRSLAVQPLKPTTFSRG